MWNTLQVKEPAILPWLLRFQLKDTLDKHAEEFPWKIQRPFFRYIFLSINIICIRCIHWCNFPVSGYLWWKSRFPNKKSNNEAPVLKSAWEFKGIALGIANGRSIQLRPWGGHHGNAMQTTRRSNSWGMPQMVGLVGNTAISEGSFTVFMETQTLPTKLYQHRPQIAKNNFCVRSLPATQIIAHYNGTLHWLVPFNATTPTPPKLAVTFPPP